MKLEKLIFPLAVLLFSQIAVAHARLKASAGVAPRSTSAGIKTGPCGPAPRVVSPPVLNAGSTLTVNWDETIQHPGRFEISISQGNDQNFVLVKTVQDTQDRTNDLPHSYSTTITLPNTQCTNCTLQLIQVMTENPSSPSLYYSCADFSLVGGTAPSPTPAATPDPNATPEPVEPCTDH